jgi:hypothetical protein
MHACTAAGWLAQVRDCISKSECMVINRKPALECMGANAEGVSAECKSLVNLLFHCKRGQIDNRARFRGNKAGS